jgi:hypothetical protein
MHARAWAVRKTSHANLPRLHYAQSKAPVLFMVWVVLVRLGLIVIRD